MAYDEIFERIRNMKRHKSKIAIQAFQWVMSVSESLKQDVLITALCQDPEQYEQSLLWICSSDVDYKLPDNRAQVKRG